MDYISYCNYGENEDYPHEAHIMPTPSGAPWNVQGLSWGSRTPPQLVQFNAQVPPQSRFANIMHCKRKSLEPEPRIPAKIHITEDKMAAHLNGLHLSTDYTTHHLAIDDMDVNMNMEGTSGESVRDKLRGHTIVLADEIRKLRDEPLIPPRLLERLEKPCMSLVVWQPKENVTDRINEKSDKDDEDNPKKRTGVLVPDMGMDIEMKSNINARKVMRAVETTTELPVNYYFTSV